MKISILIPSYHRHRELKNCIEDIRRKTNDMKNIEILLYLDNSDKKSIKYAQDENLIYFISDVSGYKYMNAYYSVMAENVKGEYFFLYKDDATIGTYNWDLYFLMNNQEKAIYYPKNSPEFPIMHRSIFDSIGHIALHPYVSEWVHEFGKTVGRLIPIENFIVHHSTGNISRRNADDIPNYFNQYTIDKIKQDSEYYKTKENNVLLSFLIPTRKRVDGLRNTIKSIIDNSLDRNLYEILIAIDSDDESSMKFSQEFCDKNVRFFHIKRFPNGYGDLNKYYEFLYNKSCGKFFHIFNDDTVLVTNNWEHVLNKYRNKLCVLWPAWNHTNVNAFPIVHSDIPRTTELFCPTQFPDRWFGELANRGKIHYKCFDGSDMIYIDHIGDTDRRVNGPVDGSYPFISAVETGKLIYEHDALDEDLLNKCNILIEQENKNRMSIKISNNKLVSILMPTRNRLSNLIKSLESIEKQTKDKNEIEIIFKVDSDDRATIDYLINYSALPHKIIISDRPVGKYTDLHLIHNEMWKASSGNLLFIFTDDSIMETYAWDEILSKYRNDKTAVIHINSNATNPEQEFILPIVHRKLTELIGTYSIHPSLDQQYEMLVDRIPQLYRKEFNIKIHHDCLPGEHIKENVVNFDPWIKNTKKIADQMDIQASIIKDYIGNNL